MDRTAFCGWTSFRGPAFVDEASRSGSRRGVGPGEHLVGPGGHVAGLETVLAALRAQATGCEFGGGVV